MWVDDIRAFVGILLEKVHVDWHVCMMPLWFTKKTWPVVFGQINFLLSPLSLSLLAQRHTLPSSHDSRHGKKRQEKIQIFKWLEERRDGLYFSRAWLVIATLLP